MNVPDQIVYIGLTSALGLQAWQLKEIITMKGQLIALKTELDTHRSTPRPDRSRSVLAALLLLFVPLVGLGCKTAPAGSLGGLLSPRQVVTRQVEHTPIVTHQAVVSDVAGITHTNFVTLTNVETRTYYVTNTVWETAPAVRETLNAVNSFSGLAGPGAPFVSFGTTAAALILGVIAKRKNDRGKSLAAQLQAVVKGVEKASQTLPDGSQIKRTIAAAAEKLDVGKALHKSVKELT